MLTFIIVLPSDIPTAVKPSEANLLLQVASGGVVLECGAFYGFSTVMLAQVARLVHSVDWHRGDEHAGQVDTLPDYLENLKRYNVTDRVITHLGRFEDVLPYLRRGSFDGCFLDGQHDRASLDRDLRLIHPLIGRTGWIAVHDYGLFDVAPALEDFVSWSGYELVRVAETLAVLRPRVHLARKAARRLPEPVRRTVRQVMRHLPS
ncbi:MAG: class I SAM-dependent methyltransferase [Acidimicrobiaceae bacterium]|nr:class I SAM-dependent methyltransferase [Acidimicrobiaceae bacterium]